MNTARSDTAFVLLPGSAKANRTSKSEWNCRGFKDRAKRANFSLYLETFEHLCAVFALQEPGNAVCLTGYNTFQRDPFTSLLVHKTLTGQEVDLDLSISYSYTMVTALPLRRTDPPVHILNICCRPKLKKITFADTFGRALKIAGRDPFLIVDDFNAPSRLWGYRKEEMRGRKLGSTTQLALSLRDRYLCTEQDQWRPEYHYAGRENADLDAPLQLHHLRVALAKMRRGTAPGAAYIRIQDQEYGPYPLGTRGTPQGAVLSPLLFNLAMVQLPARLDAVDGVKHALYADDITLWATEGNLGNKEDSLQAAAHIVDEYAA
ncbi:hypothetical protein HPB49_022959 [Dermacentor silvarum]|uniref:Uncharacterized protein n=1 Tax=Dermacentor silvarum TaxID=543639 RepID=A0ACB8DGL5_DERSI|nr:hypothetical protein HPB49_022959 [Dermacentor silvarum]